MPVAKFVFRVDGGPIIGSGHVVRCLTLAQKLHQSGLICMFITRPDSGPLIDQIGASGFEVSTLSERPEPPASGQHESWIGNWAADADEFAEAVSRLQDNRIVVITDHYGIDHRWQSRIGKMASSLIVIDDLADRRHHCDILIDQNLGRTAADYAGLVPNGCELLCGTSFSILRDGFLGVRDRSLVTKRSKTAPKRYLVSMGGADRDNFSAIALAAIEELASAGVDVEHVDILLGGIAANANELRERIKNSSLPVTLHIDSDQVPQLMADADLAIGAAGTTLLERLVVGLPVVVLANASNQVRLLGMVDDYGFGRYAGWVNEVSANDLAETIRGITSDPGKWHEMVMNSSRLCDGEGCNRVVEAIRLQIEE
ncbi:UDP-2,4-diacetamido-2,4,6-trideoxy-beta-L-altropyranose hydrolase [Labrenzia sp. PO1]|uniref:UDP-2,4-diacetamido-2,4, 6-trideoxy-beta-L-altropyranose hydrolase n=1 Tax=Labrenzia sp. PO1 TaxID=2720390 RepID=UPI0014460E37|nr:UDP-2,4-diacetamido-2,4,6-trideoxy-beta-L-altropyranose hydrolase [Labrenzia sp. PO1]NKI58349.1 UDP-2,4-diacetamido-2,4,6-trideoxy-beta-L-altropyranose hydrolase [Labrenzia sp. PO1]